MDAAALASPNLYPLIFDIARDAVRMVVLDETRYRAASFLDERLLAQAEPGEWIARASLEQAAAGLDGECDFIFHIGHVGSTLLSRLLDISDRVFSLREPAILRTLAMAAMDGADPRSVEQWTGMFLKLWSRVYRPGQRALLKATSFTAEIGPVLMRLNPSASAILMVVSPSIHLATIFGGEASRVELNVNAPMRLERLNRRLGGPVWRLDDLSEGEIAAMSWACEIMALAQIARAFPGRILWLDFEAFLQTPPAGLAASLQRLHGAAPEADLRAMLASPDLNRYSKAPEHAYSAELRDQVLAQARARHRAEIDRGLDWLNAAGRDHAVLADSIREVAAAIRSG